MALLVLSARSMPYAERIVSGVALPACATAIARVGALAVQLLGFALRVFLLAAADVPFGLCVFGCGPAEERAALKAALDRRS